MVVVVLHVCVCVWKWCSFVMFGVAVPLCMVLK